jgi:hypothetical protein
MEFQHGYAEEEESPQGGEEAVGKAGPGIEPGLFLSYSERNSADPNAPRARPNQLVNPHAQSNRRRDGY